MIIAFVLTLSTVFSYSSFAQTGEDSTPTHELNASVEVAGFAQLILEPDELSLGMAQPGESTDPTALGITCMTNLNEPWSLSMHVDDPLRTETDEFVILNSNVNWRLLNSDGEMVLYGTMPSEPFVIYTAGMEDYVTETPIELALIFSIDIPQGQAKGAYSTLITVTMQPENMQP